MTGRQLAAIWAAALALALGAIAALAAREPGTAQLVQVVRPTVEAGPRAVFIGSSLSEAAIPARGSADAPLPFSWQRLSLGGLAAYRQLAMAEAAADGGASLLLIELDTPLRALGTPPPWPAPALLELSDRIRPGPANDLPARLNREGRFAQGDGPQTGEPGRIAVIAPRQPGRWLALAQRMRTGGGALLLLGFPHPERFGHGTRLREWQRLAEAGRGFAAALDAPLFQPQLLWPDRYFADAGHLNAEGRARYLRELDAWLRARG